jgi:hypothetical protein
MCFAGGHRNDRTSIIPIVFCLFGFITGSPPSLARLRLSGRRRSFAGTASHFERIGAGDRTTMLADRRSRLSCAQLIGEMSGANSLWGGPVIGRNMQRHRHQEFIRFLNAVEAQAQKEIHAIVDNYATHKPPKVRQWLTRHPRWAFHFTATSASCSTPSRASSPSSRSDD